MRGCEWPRCRNRAGARSAYCPAHARQLPDHLRPGGRSGFRSPAWRLLAASVLVEQPYCATPGCPNPSAQVDHIVERRDGGTDDRHNLQGLCLRCHGRKTGRRTAQSRIRR